MSNENNMFLHDHETEKAVIASMIMSNDALQLGFSELYEDDFTNEMYRLCFLTLKYMYRQDELIDIISLNTRLMESQQYPSNGIALLSEIASSSGTSIYIKQYIKILKELTYRRNVFNNSQELIEMLNKNSPIENISSHIEKMQKLESSQSELMQVSTVLENTLKKIYSTENKYAGLKTKFIDFDVMTSGLQNTDLIVIAARPSMGKTAFVLDLLRNTSEEIKKQNKVSVMFSLEMSNEQLALRMFSAETKIKSDKFKFNALTIDDYETIKKIAPEYDEKSSVIYVSEEMGMSIGGIVSQCYTLKSRVNKEIGLIVIDYLQLIETKGENRNNEIASITRGCKRLAKEFNCPVIILSQLSRECEKRANHRPILSDLRESGSIEQDADIVAFLYRDEYYFPDSEMKNVAELIIAKQRNGPIGTVNLLFDSEHTTFKNMIRR